ncbi:HD-GYP domain-containing protein [Chloroflexota bacterium]
MHTNTPMYIRDLETILACDLSDVYLKQWTKERLEEMQCKIELTENTGFQQEVQDGCKSAISALAATIDAKDPYTCGHSKRVKKYALLGGIQLSLSKNELEVIEYGGLLHDIGNVGISDNILRKPGPLNSQELIIMREHPMIGFNILKDIPFLEEVSRLVLHHHERYDGKGYPMGLQGADISMGARLIAIADSFDTMTTDRSYRAAINERYAIGELLQYTYTQFCPIAVDAFIAGYQKQSGNSGKALNTVTK